MLYLLRAARDNQLSSLRGFENFPSCRSPWSIPFPKEEWANLQEQSEEKVTNECLLKRLRQTLMSKEGLPSPLLLKHIKEGHDQYFFLPVRID